MTRGHFPKQCFSVLNLKFYHQSVNPPYNLIDATGVKLCTFLIWIVFRDKRPSMPTALKSLTLFRICVYSHQFCTQYSKTSWCSGCGSTLYTQFISKKIRSTYRMIKKSVCTWWFQYSVRCTETFWLQCSFWCCYKFRPQLPQPSSCSYSNRALMQRRMQTIRLQFMEKYSAADWNISYLRLITNRSKILPKGVWIQIFT